MVDIVPKPISDGHCDMMYGLRSSFCIKASMEKLRFGVISDIGSSLLRYCMACLIFGLALVNGWEHNNPSFSARHASSISYSP